jgi:hypothetical protein
MDGRAILKMRVIAAAAAAAARVAAGVQVWIGFIRATPFVLPAQRPESGSVSPA